LPVPSFSERDVLHVVRERDVRDELRRVQLRDRRVVQRRLHRDRLLHVLDWVYAGDGGRCVQHVRERVLPERDGVHCLPDWLCGVRELDDVHDVHQRPSASAWWDVVRVRVPERVLLDRQRVRCVREHVRDVQQCDGVPDVLVDGRDAVPERDELRVDVPERDVSVWDVVPGVQQQLQDVLWDVDDVHVVPERPGAEHADERVRCVVPDWVHCRQRRLQPVPERLLRVVLHRLSELQHWWWHVQRWSLWERDVLLCERLHRSDMQLVQLVVLPEWDDVPCLPWQLHDVH